MCLKYGKSQPKRAYKIKKVYYAYLGVRISGGSVYEDPPANGEQTAGKNRTKQIPFFTDAGAVQSLDARHYFQAQSICVDRQLESAGRAALLTRLSKLHFECAYFFKYGDRCRFPFTCCQ